MGSCAMPRYFFHVVQGQQVYRDCIGQEYPNKKAALREARLVAGELVRDAAFADRSLDHVVEVRDDNGNVILSFQCYRPGDRRRWQRPRGATIAARRRLATSKQPFDVAKLKLHIGRPAMVALAGIGSRFHLP
jgi:Domain of unknown function (DUF6894)